MRSFSLRDEILPAFGRQFRDAVEPARVELAAHVLLQKVLADDAVAFGEPHQPAFVGHEALVDVVELLDEGIDARLVEPQRLHLGDDLFLQLLVLALLRRRQRGVLQAEFDVLLLQAAQALERIRRSCRRSRPPSASARPRWRRAKANSPCRLRRNRSRPRPRPDPSAPRRPRRAGALKALRRRALPAAPASARPADAARRERACRPPAASACRRGRYHRRLHLLGVGTGVGRFEVDDVAEEDFSFVELVAPDDDGLEGERAFAEARDHRLAAGLDALGDGDFALAREQLDRAHLAQIHAHGIVGALGRLFLLGGGERLGFASTTSRAGVIVIVVVFGLSSRRRRLLRSRRR